MVEISATGTSVAVPLKTLVIVCATAVCALLMAACATSQNAPWAELGRIEAHQGPRLAPGDKLKITVFDEKDLSGEFVISETGMVAMPLIGPIKAQGRTVDTFKRALNKKLANGYLEHPRTTVEVKTYRPIFVHGEVRDGGEKPYRPGLTFRDAVASAGGYTYRAEESYILLTRRGKRRAVKVAMPSTARVRPGDNIRVPERFF